MAKGPITYVAGNNDRNLKIKTKEGVFQIDPNNAFCVPGVIRCFDFLQNKGWNSLRKETQDYLIIVIKNFTDEVSRRIFVDKMVLALHQNTIGGFGIRSYLKDPKFLRHTADININPNESNDIFAYVNTRGWFEVLKAKDWNVVLQKNDKSTDDGSISYATTWRGFPYINIEVELGNEKKQADMIRTINALIDKYPLLKLSMNYNTLIEERNIQKIFQE